MRTSQLLQLGARSAAPANMLSILPTDLLPLSPFANDIKNGTSGITAGL